MKGYLVKATCGCTLGLIEARRRFFLEAHASWLYCDKHGNVRDPNIGMDEKPIINQVVNVAPKEV